MSTTIDGSASVTINSGAVLGITSGTAVASTSGTSIDFTGIPSWVKRITVMFNGVSTNGVNTLWLIQLGTGGVPETSGYSCTASLVSSAAAASTNSTTGFGISKNNSAADLMSGSFQISNISGNTWVLFGAIGNSASPQTAFSAGSKTLAGVLNMLRIATNSADTFDAGSINILYE